MSNTKNFTVLNTVNTVLDGKADFIIHADGCADCDRGESKACDRETVTAVSAEAVIKGLRADLESEGFSDEEAAGFAILTMPCATA